MTEALPHLYVLAQVWPHKEGEQCLNLNGHSGMWVRQHLSARRIRGTMPKLERSQWYDLYRDMNWNFKYVTEAEVFPDVLAQSHSIPAAAWWNWDEPYKISYREYVHNQAAKDAEVYSVRSAIARSRLFEHLDLGWKSTLISHYGTSAIPEYLASLGEARMGRFGRAAAWRNNDQVLPPDQTVAQAGMPPMSFVQVFYDV